MSRVYDWLLVSVISIISITVHTMAVELFGPESALHQKASTAQHFNAAAKVDQWFEIITVWAPLMVIAGIVLWAGVREYRRQTTGTVRRVPR